jgi:hypothetical protein
MTDLVICPKCKKDSYPPVRVSIPSRGKLYAYEKYTHPKRWGRSRQCYVRVAG